MTQKFDLTISTLQKWFCSTELKLNTSKTVFMKVVQNSSFNVDLKLPVDSKFLKDVKFLGFILDDKLLFLKQISSVTSACCYMLRKSIRDPGDSDVLIELVRVLIISRIGYCNSVYYRLHAVLHGKLQQIMNCACRVIFRLTRYTNFKIHQAVALVT